MGDAAEEVDRVDETCRALACRRGPTGRPDERTAVLRLRRLRLACCVAVWLRSPGGKSPSPVPGRQALGSSPGYWLLGTSATWMLMTAFPTWRTLRVPAACYDVRSAQPRHRPYQHPTCTRCRICRQARSLRAACLFLDAVWILNGLSAFLAQ